MSLIWRYLVFILAITLPLMGEKPPHLVLYFDINQTLIASDKAGQKSVADVLNELLAEKYIACWTDSQQDPIPFDQFVRTSLIPGSATDPTLLQQRKQAIHHFVDYLREHNHPLYPTVAQDYQTTLAALEHTHGEIFASFYALLDYLELNQNSYSIILRSFGHEIFDLKDQVNALYKPLFTLTGKFREGKLYMSHEILYDPQAIYQQLRRSPHAAIHDDWQYWNAHGGSASYGKPFYIDRHDPDTLSIFFDDNINKDDSPQNIIIPLDATTGQPIPIRELVESGKAVRVDTLQAILDLSYYINLVEAALEKHSLQPALL